MLYGAVSGVLYKIASGIFSGYIKTYNVKFLRDDQEKVM